MSLSQTYISRKQLIADNLNTVGVADASVNDGLTTLANKILNASATANTSLTIDVPLNLVYGDDFNITGILSDSNGNLLGGQTVKLLVGSTVVDTSTTDNDGEVSFTRSPVSMGNHSFQLVFDGVSTGGSTYSPCQSSIVSRVINKETSVLNLTNPSGSLTVYTDGYFTVAGTLKEDDGVAMANKNIIVSDGTNTLATLTTSSDGSFTGSVNIPNAGNYTLTVSYGGDTYYTGSSVSRSITVNPVELNFALTDGSDILSYADEQQTPNSQYATFTATFVGANIVNQAVELYKDNVLWDTLYTDNNGKVSKTYYSEGVGDIEFKAVKGTLVSKIYEVQDCNFFDASSSANVSKYSVGSGASFSYDTNNSAYSLYPSSSGAKFVSLNNLTFNKDNKVSIDVNITSAPTNAQYGFVIGNVAVRIIKAGNTQRITISNSAVSSDYTYTDCTVSTNTWYTLELLPTGVFNLKQGDTIVATCNYDISSLLTDNNSFKLYVAHTSTTRGNVKNIMIKPL